MINDKLLDKTVEAVFAGAAWNYGASLDAILEKNSHAKYDATQFVKWWLHQDTGALGAASRYGDRPLPIRRYPVSVASDALAIYKIFKDIEKNSTPDSKLQHFSFLFYPGKHEGLSVIYKRLSERGLRNSGNKKNSKMHYFNLLEQVASYEGFIAIRPNVQQIVQQFRHTKQDLASQDQTMAYLVYSALEKVAMPTYMLAPVEINKVKQALRIQAQGTELPAAQIRDGISALISQVKEHLPEEIRNKITVTSTVQSPDIKTKIVTVTNNHPNLNNNSFPFLIAFQSALLNYSTAGK